MNNEYSKKDLKNYYNNISFDDNLEVKIESLLNKVHNTSESIIDGYYENLYNLENKLPEDKKCSYGGHGHCHKCALEIQYGDKLAKKKCKEYLKSKGMKRDKNMLCCDVADPTSCKYMTYILLGNDDTIVAAY